MDNFENLLDSMKKAEFSSKNNIRNCYKNKISTTNLDFFELNLVGIDVNKILNELQKISKKEFEFFKINYFGSTVYAFSDIEGKDRFHLEEKEDGYVYLIDTSNEQLSNPKMHDVLHRSRIFSYLA